MSWRTRLELQGNCWERIYNISLRRGPHDRHTDPGHARRSAGGRGGACHEADRRASRGVGDARVARRADVSRDPDAAARQRSRLVFDAWHRWIADAEGLLRRVAPLEGRGTRLPRLEELRRGIALARSTVKMTLEKVERARAQVQTGDTVGGEEVRRELQL